MLGLEVPIIVLLAEKTMSVQQVMRLSPGSIIELPKPAEEKLELLVNNKVIGRGDASLAGMWSVVAEYHDGMFDRTVTSSLTVDPTNYMRKEKSVVVAQETKEKEGVNIMGESGLWDFAIVSGLCLSLY